MGQGGPPEKRRPYGYLFFWPAFGLRYLLLEACSPVEGYDPVFCALDDKIPFLEWFVLPYFLWHICMVGVHLWLYLRDGRVYRQYSWYLIISMSVSTAVFLLWPTCQNLRPDVFPRDNVLTGLVKVLYRMDTNTNVCPSEHVIGAAGFFLAAVHSARMGIGAKWGMGIIALLSAAATVFLKQHSVLDIAAAVPVCMAGYFSGFTDLLIPIRKEEGKRMNLFFFLVKEK